MPPAENRLLAALPAPDRARLSVRMTDVIFGHKDLVYRAGGPIEHVYFPYSGMLSAVVIMTDGGTAEAAAMGHEGMAGMATAFGATRSSEQVFCQIPQFQCRRLPAAEFVAEVAKGGPLRDVVYGYLRSVLTVSARHTACNCLHPNDERLAMWLLRCRDAVGADEFSLTHEFMATMLGVRRATVTVTASTLQSAGLISYKHGKIKVVDAVALEQAACECYPVIRDAFQASTS